ncbi:MAG: antitoxin Xre-like helix-turn-helix domain-containing protein, partial [Steroidobacteraceae bacterium]
MKLLKALRAGLPSMTLRRFKRATGLADEEVAELLGVGGRTLTRLKASPRLPADLSDRLYAVVSVYALAERVFGDRATAIGWLGEPQRQNSLTPAALAVRATCARSGVSCAPLGGGALAQSVEH